MTNNRDFENKYDSKISEAKIREFWEKEQVFTFNPSSKKEIYSIDTPPPTFSGRMHVGHSFSYSQQDFMARYMRMTGKEVYFPFGVDDNGLATEKLVQKEVGINLRKVSRQEAISTVLKYIEENRGEFVQDWKDLGVSCDFNLFYSSIGEYSQKISQKSFIDLVNKGLIYRKKGPVPWDRVFQTPIAQAELEDQKLKSFLNYIKAKVKNSKDMYMIYATTRPELLFGCVGMSVEKEGDYVKLKVGKEYWITGKNTYEEKFKDFKYEVVEELKGKNLIGEKVIIPLSKNEVEVDHDDSVKADYGTGIVYFCTYGGMDCIEWMAGRPHLEPISLLNKDGTLNENNGKYKGIVTSDARKPIMDDIKHEGLLVMKEKIEHIVNVGERSGVEVEYIITEQWYVKYLDQKEFFWERAQELNWHPDFMKHRVENWIKGLNWDWGFSRQRHFGIPIPVWYDKKENQYLPDESQLPVDPTKDRPNNAPKNLELIPEMDVFDTWFTSASTPFLAINLAPENIRDKLFPMNLRPQGHDIINFWLFYTLAKTNLIYDKNPWKDCAISGWVLDPSGKKMSKSKGNVISPQEMMSKYSADALRFGAGSSKLGSDLPFPEKELVSGVKVCNKLYNANKFASMLLKDFDKLDRDFEFSELKSIDKWIVAKAQKVFATANKGFSSYDYSKAKFEFENYFMKEIADNYIEIVKARLWNPELHKNDYKKAQKALYYSLYNSLKGFAPFMPYITEEIFQIFYSRFEDEKSIHLTKYPIYNEKYDNQNIIEHGDKFIEVVSAVRKYKAENNLSQKAEIEKLEISCGETLKDFIEDSIEDLKAVTSAKEIIFKNQEEGFGININ